MQHCGCGLYNVYLTYGPSLTLIYFTTRSNVFLNVFIWVKTLEKMSFFFLVTVEAKLKILTMKTLLDYTPAEIRSLIEVRFNMERALDKTTLISVTIVHVA